MHHSKLRMSAGTVLVTAAVAVGGAVAPIAAAAPAANRFTVTPLVSDQPGKAQLTDPSLVNAWGMSQGPTTPVWVSDNGTGVATLYTGATPTSITKVMLTVAIPGGDPTGQAFNGDTTAFPVGPMGSKVSARFLFATESGIISGWSPMLADTSHAVAAVTVRNAVYKGLTVAADHGRTRLYAADFHHGRVDVRDASFRSVHRRGAFVDNRLPRGYAPFGIAALGGKIYVSYALRDAKGHDDVPGAGHGFVDVYSASGHLLSRLIRHGALDSPWGLAIAPSGWGPFGGDLLVGNFGDGRIHAYNPRTGRLLGTLRDATGHAIVIPGLWGLLFGNGTSAPASALMFSAGPGGEAHGLFGLITAAM